VGAIVALFAVGCLVPALGASKPTHAPISVTTDSAHGLLVNAPLTSSSDRSPPQPLIVARTPAPFSIEVTLSILILIFGVAVLVLETVLLLKSKANPAYVFRTFAVTVILIGTLFVIAAGFGSEQIAPAMGLFGTIAGYLLGRHATAHNDLKGGGESA
jgi:hypothetical protein